MKKSICPYCGSNLVSNAIFECPECGFFIASWNSQKQFHECLEKRILFHNKVLQIGELLSLAETNLGQGSYADAEEIAVFLLDYFSEIHEVATNCYRILGLCQISSSGGVLSIPALKLFARAGILGDQESCLTLANNYNPLQNGQWDNSIPYYEQDFPSAQIHEAIFWYEKAIANGSSIAAFDLGQLYVTILNNQVYGYFYKTLNTKMEKLDLSTTAAHFEGELPHEIKSLIDNSDSIILEESTLNHIETLARRMLVLNQSTKERLPWLHILSDLNDSNAQMQYAKQIEKGISHNIKASTVPIRLSRFWYKMAVRNNCQNAIIHLANSYIKYSGDIVLRSFYLWLATCSTDTEKVSETYADMSALLPFEVRKRIEQTHSVFDEEKIVQFATNYYGSGELLPISFQRRTLLLRDLYHEAKNEIETKSYKSAWVKLFYIYNSCPQYVFVQKQVLLEIAMLSRHLKKYNAEEVIQWLSISSSAGSIAAEFQLGVLYDPYNDFYRDSAKKIKDARHSIYWYKQASLHGNNAALNNLATLCYNAFDDCIAASFYCWLANLQNPKYAKKNYDLYIKSVPKDIALLITRSDSLDCEQDFFDKMRTSCPACYSLNHKLVHKLLSSEIVYQCKACGFKWTL